jgi:hypothetical protein
MTSNSITEFGVTVYMVDYGYDIRYHGKSINQHKDFVPTVR